MDNTDLIAKARELCDTATPGPWKSLHGIPNPSVCQDPDWDKEISIVNGSMDYGGWKYHQATRDADLIAASRTLVPQLCDALEAAEKEIERRQRIHEDMVVKFGELADRAEKAEAELSELRTPKAAVALKMDTVVQIGHVRFGPGCTIYKCPCCGTFLTPTHKYCLECGQAVSYPKPPERSTDGKT